jgi:hypothetical protein
MIRPDKTASAEKKEGRQGFKPRLLLRDKRKIEGFVGG